jgi:hypothetical protein
MKKTCLLLLTLAALLTLTFSLPVQAEEEAAKYNFASAQGDKELKIPPGEEGQGYIYFYNVDGNRITHITLEVSQAPAGWQVTVEPPLSETRVLVSGMPVTVTENLYVEPSELLSEEPQSIPEDMVSIKVPGRGYALGKLVQVVVKVPESASLGSTGVITIAGEAAWLGQSGSAAVKQARDFEFNVTVASGSTEYTERILKPGEEIEEPVKTAPAEATPSSEGQSQGSSLMKWLPAIIAAILVIAGALVIPRLIARRRRN